MTIMNTNCLITTSRKVPRPRLGIAWLLGWLMLAAWFGFGRDWLKNNPAPAQAAVNSSASRQALAAGQSDVRTRLGPDAARLANYRGKRGLLGGE